MGLCHAGLQELFSSSLFQARWKQDNDIEQAHDDHDGTCVWVHCRGNTALPITLQVVELVLMSVHAMGHPDHCQAQGRKSTLDQTWSWYARHSFQVYVC